MMLVENAHQFKVGREVSARHYNRSIFGYMQFGRPWTLRAKLGPRDILEAVLSRRVRV
jgi:hypothetical protein